MNFLEKFFPDIPLSTSVPKVLENSPLLYEFLLEHSSLSLYNIFDPYHSIGSDKTHQVDFISCLDIHKRFFVNLSTFDLEQYKNLHVQIRSYICFFLFYVFCAIFGTICFLLAS